MLSSAIVLFVTLFSCLVSVSISCTYVRIKQCSNKDDGHVKSMCRFTVEIWSFY